MDDVFRRALTAARERYGNDRWLTMTSREQTSAIYEEMRKIDQERRDTANGAGEK